MDLTTNGVVITDAIEFVHTNKQKLTMSKEEDDKESKEPDYNFSAIHTTDIKLTLRLLIPRFSERCFARSLIFFISPLTIIVSRQLSFLR